MAQFVYNSHHRRAHVSGQGAVKHLRKMSQEFEAELHVSNSSQELQDKIAKAFILVDDVVTQLDARKIAHAAKNAQARKTLHDAPNLGVEG